DLESGGGYFRDRGGDCREGGIAGHGAERHHASPGKERVDVKGRAAGRERDERREISSNRAGLPGLQPGGFHPSHSGLRQDSCRLQRRRTEDRASEKGTRKAEADPYRGVNHYDSF